MAGTSVFQLLLAFLLNRRVICIVISRQSKRLRECERDREKGGKGEREKSKGGEKREKGRERARERDLGFDCDIPDMSYKNRARQHKKSRHIQTPAKRPF